MSWVLIWLIALLVLIGIEVITLGLTTIWFAGGALLAAICAAVGLPEYIQIAVFLLVSLVLLLFTRPVAVKYFNKDRVKTNAEGLVGQTAIVTKEINNISGIGNVIINGMEWSAKSVNGESIAEGAVVVIRAISGVKLIVEERKEEA